MSGGVAIWAVLDPTPVDYEVSDTSGVAVTATVTVSYGPEAVDDESLDNVHGSTVTVDPLANDSTDVDPTTVMLIDPASGDPVTSLVVPGEGVWTVDPVTGAITFTPDADFDGNPTPVDYEVSDTSGNTVEATVTVSYLPAPANDESLGNPIGSTVTVDPLANDTGDLDPTTVMLLDPASGDPVTSLVVPGEGVWTVDPVTGATTFTPNSGFKGNPTPVDYQVLDIAGELIEAQIVVTYQATQVVVPSRTVATPEGPGPITLAPPGPVPATPVPAADEPPVLALTGSETLQLLVLALMMLGSGVATVGLSWRLKSKRQ